MTLIATVIAPDFGLMATDSAAFAPDGRHVGNITKMAALTHAKALLAVQGAWEMLSFIASNSWAFASIDDAENVMPRLLAEASTRMRGRLMPRGENVGSIVYLLGFSEARGRMVLMTWTSGDGFLSAKAEVYSKASGHGLVIARPAPAPQPKAPITDAEGLQRYVHQHVGMLRARDPAEPVGGAIVLARVDRHGLRITYGKGLGMPTVQEAEAERPQFAILREISAAIYDVDALFNTLDVAPNTGLPKPDVVEQITGVTVTSGTSTELDKSILSRTTVSWTAATTQQVRQSGTIEVQYRRGGEAAPSGDWPNVVVPGNATSATIVGLGQGLHYVFRVRARTTLGARGDWSVLEVGQVATVPQVGTGGIADEAASAIDSQTQSGSTNVYLTDADIVTGTIDSGGAPIYVSASVDAFGSYSGDKATFKIKLDGTTVLTKDITTTRDTNTLGNPWAVKGAIIQFVIQAPATGTRTIKLTAIGTHATYGVTVENCNLYLEAKKK